MLDLELIYIMQNINFQAVTTFLLDNLTFNSKKQLPATLAT